MKRKKILLEEMQKEHTYMIQNKNGKLETLKEKYWKSRKGHTFLIIHIPPDYVIGFSTKGKCIGCICLFNPLPSPSKV